MIGKSFCDLNILATDSHLRETVLQALKIGYQTIAINTEVTDSWSSESKKKKRKKGEQDQVIPDPITLRFTAEELMKHGIKNTPTILNRLTITYSEPSTPFMHKAKSSFNKYDILAFTPTTESALKQVCVDMPHVDIISLDANQRDLRIIAKQVRLALKKDIYFEISYSPCIGNSSTRLNIFTFAHRLFRKIRGRNVIVTSKASSPDYLRAPYDVMNLARFFDLTEIAAKESILTQCHDLIHCAKSRRIGLNKCFTEVTMLNNDNERPEKFSKLDDASAFCRSTLEVND